MPVESKRTNLSLQDFSRGIKGNLDVILEKPLTIAINVNSTGVALAIVVGVGLVGVSLKHTVVTAVANIISVCVILGRVVHSWAVVLNS